MIQELESLRCSLFQISGSLLLQPMLAVDVMVGA